MPGSAGNTTTNFRKEQKSLIIGLSGQAAISIAELDVLEPADGIALVGDDLCLPDKGDRHGTHDQEAEDKSDHDVRLVNLAPKDAAHPFHGRGSP